MRRILLLLGACVLLFAVETGAAKHSKKNFLDFGDLWGGSDNAATATGTNADFTLEPEGSGSEENKDNTHADDEDFDDGSGDHDDTMVDLTTDAPDTEDNDEDDTEDNDKDYYDNKETTDDEDDLLDGSGVSSGDGIDEETIVPELVKPVENIMTTTRKPVTACENLRSTALQAKSAFKPECDLDGSFKKQQCMEDVAMKEENCWCVDRRGIEIPGTRMSNPSKPDCTYGENLKTCVFQLVQQSFPDMTLGAFKPKCTILGEFEPIQCHGSECWCVDVVGDAIMGTKVNKPEIPKCPPVTQATPKPTKPVTKLLPEPEEPGYTVPEDSKEDIPNVIVNIGPEIPLDSGESDLEEQEEETNAIGESYATMKQNEPILAQPGLLAAIIGGAVVGLLCIVLLVMFIVYRMRKKDEGSYPLDEQKYQNYSYAKAPDKEFYA